MKKELTLRNCQSECVDNLQDCRENGSNKALVVMAPALGKTITAAYDMDRYIKENDGRVLYLCHNADILETAKREFEKVLGEDEYTFGYYTGFKKTEGRTDILFATFQTMQNNLSKFKPDEFNYIIVDEAHHAQAKTYKKVLEYFTPDFMLGLTATPHRTDGKKLLELFDNLAYEKDFIDATFDDEMLLSPVDYRLMMDEIMLLEDIIADDNQQYSIAELNRKIFAPKRDEEIVKLIQENIAKKDNPKTIIFCKSIEHANNIAALIDGSTVVHSYINAKECEDRLEGFRNGEYHTIISVDKLNEGINIPSVDVIVFLRSTVSQIVFYQQLGRGLRKHQGKENVLVLDFVANCERLEIIEGLRYKVQAAEEKARKYHRQVSDRFNININTPEFKKYEIDIYDFIRKAREQNQPYTKEELIKQLQDKASELGRTPFTKDANSDPGMASSQTFQNAFGSWNKALEAAGLNVTCKRNYTKEGLIKQLQDKASELGRTPFTKDADSDPSMACSVTFQKVFGSWNNALEAAGLNVVYKTNYTKEGLIKQLQNKTSELGKIPTRKDINSDPSMASSTTFHKVFGSWNNALEDAGLEPTRKKK